MDSISSNSEKPTEMLGPTGRSPVTPSLVVATRLRSGWLPRPPFLFAAGKGPVRPTISGSRLPPVPVPVILFAVVKRKSRQPLQDDAKRVHREFKDSNSKLRDEIIAEFEKRLLGEERSSSVNAISGGRPESNRRKF
jgi:hypothetical protein